MAILKLIMLEHYYKLIDSSFKNANEYNSFDVAPQVWIEHTHQGVWSRILDLNQYTAETVFKPIHRILLELILESPLPYRLATPAYCVLRPRIPILHRGHPTHF